MYLSNVHLTKDDFASSQWENVISVCDDKKCCNYSSVFWRKSQETQASDNTKAQVVFALLAGITSPRLKSESNDDPFYYMDFINFISEAHLNALKDWALEISDAELRARVSDILWVRKRDYLMAQLAIDSYLESSILLEEPDLWSSCFDRIERAIRLARKANQKLHFTKVVTHIEAILDRYNGEDRSFFSANLMELLQEYKQDGSSKYVALAEKAAHRAEAEHNWHKARDYWKVKAGWHVLEKDADKERTASLLLAETYVKESEDALNRTPPSYSVACAHLQKAIAALRRIGGTKERVEELHKILLEYQQETRNEMISFSQQMDIAHFVEQATENVKGKNIQEALFTLAVKMGTSPSVVHLRTQIQEDSKKYIVQHLFPMVMVNETGKVTARQSSMLSNDPKEVEEATRNKMFKQAIYYQQMQAQAFINPARYQINLEHNVRISDFFPIVVNNPFVPPNREYIYAQGLHAGLTGDFLIAANLLIPQIENSIRYLLNNQGVITSGFDDQGIQDERSLNTTLYLPEIIAIWGEDVAFDLQGLLVERFGSNLRNKMAHGLLNENQFFQPEFVYLWWLTLCLCCLPILSQAQNSQAESGEPSEDSEGDADTVES